MKRPLSYYIIPLLRWSTVLILLGRAWQHLVWDAPFHLLFEDQALLGGFVESFLHMDWEEYLNSSEAASFTNILTKAFGTFYLGMAVLSLFLKKGSKRLNFLYWMLSLSLACLAFLYFKEKSYQAPQFFEYCIQFLTPLLFYYSLTQQFSSQRLFLFVKISIAFTFIAHGMYAVGLYPQPRIFVEMTTRILGVGESAAQVFLTVMGILDFVIGIGIFVPRLAGLAFAYACLWGIATAVARTWAHVSLGSDFFVLLNQYLPQTLYRLPHGLIPLLAFVLWKELEVAKTNEKMPFEDSQDLLKRKTPTEERLE